MGKFLITYQNNCCNLNNQVQQGVLDDFKDLGRGLAFAYEHPVDGILQFSDLRLNFNESQVCWMHSQEKMEAGSNEEYR